MTREDAVLTDSSGIPSQKVTPTTIVPSVLEDLDCLLALYSV